MRKDGRKPGGYITVEKRSFEVDRLAVQEGALMCRKGSQTEKAEVCERRC